MGIRKSNITPSINVDDMLKSAEISHEIEAEKHQDGEKNIVYQGNVGYIKLNKTTFEDFSSLEITTIGKEPIHIHQIVRE